MSAAEILEELRRQNDEYRSENAKLTKLVEKHEARIQKLLRQLQGHNSEKINPDELLEACRSFFTQEELDLLEDLDPEPPQEPDLPEPPKKNPKKRKRKLDLSKLPKEREDVAVPEDECHCPACGSWMERVGHEITQKLGTRSPFYTKEYWCEKRACCCGQGIVTAKLPPQPVPNGKAEPSMLAQTVVSKFQDHVPFYRQSKIYAREGLEIGDTTLVEWSNQVADLLAPIYWNMKQEVLASGYIQADETSLRVLAKEKCDRCYLWSYGSPQGTVVFDFQPTRAARDGPNDFLADFSGKLQSDGYAGYDATKNRSDVLWFACWAHARRKFHEAEPTAKARSAKVLKYIQGLYRLEAFARQRGLTSVERSELRKEKAVPLLAALKSYLASLKDQILPKSDLGVAMNYVVKRWADFERYVDHGEVEIDNNLCENSIRGIAVGRKNYLFAGSQSGGVKAACLYSIVETCKRLEINTHEYLTDVLTRLPITPAPDTVELTPTQWAAARTAEVVESSC